jgi:hypothetical protein
MEACRKIFIEPNGLNVRVRRIPHGTNEIIELFPKLIFFNEKKIYTLII